MYHTPSDISCRSPCLSNGDMPWQGRDAVSVFLQGDQNKCFLFLAAGSRSFLTRTAIHPSPTDNQWMAIETASGWSWAHRHAFRARPRQRRNGRLRRSGANERRRVRQTQGSGDANGLLCNLAKAVGDSPLLPSSSTTPIWPALLRRRRRPPPPLLFASICCFAEAARASPHRRHRR